MQLKALDLTTIVLLGFATVLVGVVVLSGAIAGVSAVQLVTFVLGAIAGAVTGPTLRVPPPGAGSA